MTQIVHVTLKYQWIIETPDTMKYAISKESQSGPNQQKQKWQINKSKDVDIQVSAHSAFLKITITRGSQEPVSFTWFTNMISLLWPCCFSQPISGNLPLMTVNAIDFYFQ